jgi:hypothetical protein
MTVMIRQIHSSATTSNVRNIALVIDVVVLEDRSDMLHEISHGSPPVVGQRRSNSLRDGVGSRIYGRQRFGLGFVDRAQRECNRVVGVILRQVGI